MLSDTEKHRTEMVSSENKRSEESSAWSWKNLTGRRCPMVSRPARVSAPAVQEGYLERER